MRQLKRDARHKLKLPLKQILLDRFSGSQFAINKWTVMSFHHVKCLNLCILQIMKINQTHKINRPSNLSQPNPQPYLKKCSPHFAQYMCICNFLFHINASLFWMLKEKAQSFSLHKWDKSFNNFLKLCCGLSQTGRLGFEVGLGVRKTKREIKELRNLKSPDH